MRDARPTRWARQVLYCEAGAFVDAVIAFVKGELDKAYGPEDGPEDGTTEEKLRRMSR